MADNRTRSPIPESLPTDVVGPYEITELIAMDQAFVASSHCNCDRIVASLAGCRPGSHPSLLGRTSVRRECREDFMRCDVCVMAAAIMAFGAIGSTATPFITGLEHPRRLLVLPNNDVIVAEQKTGHLTLLRDQDGDGKADYIERYADDFKAPYGLAYRDGFVLVADQEGIWRVPHVSGALRAGRPEQPKITDVPPEQRKPVPAAY